jgi:hypothetical protein
MSVQTAEALEHIERMEALAAHARSLTHDPEAQCLARMLTTYAASERLQMHRKAGRLLGRAQLRVEQL